MDWKKEIKSWGLMLSLFAFLYFTGLLPTILGGMQSLVLATGLIKPNVERVGIENTQFNYEGVLTDTLGKEIQLSTFKGKTIFINLWATWCAPCRAEMPYISDLYKEFENDSSIQFLMIAIDEDFNKSKSFVEKKNFSFPIYHASHGLNSSLQTQSIPSTLVVDPEGNISSYHEGMSNFNTREFKGYLKKLSK